jgi:hypothetical protein
MATVADCPAAGKTGRATHLSAEELLERAVACGLAPLPMFGILTDWPEPGQHFCTCERADCGKNAGKHPRIKWSVVDRPPRMSHVRDWMQRLTTGLGDEFNWAFHLGLSRVVVIDVDPRNGGDESWAALAAQHGDIPATPVDRVQTRGWHGWFRMPAEGVLPEHPRTVDLAPGVELKWGAGYVLGPPSVHRCGHPYLWDEGRAPWEIDFAPLPEWIAGHVRSLIVERDRLRTQRDADSTLYAQPVGRDPYRDDEVLSRRIRGYLAKVPPAVSGQNGSRRTSRVATLLVIGFGLSISDALPYMREWNWGCQPPWSDEELRRKLEWADGQGGARGHLLNADGPRRLPERDPIAEELAPWKGVVFVHTRGGRRIWGGDGASTPPATPPPPSPQAAPWEPPGGWGDLGKPLTEEEIAEREAEAAASAAAKAAREAEAARWAGPDPGCRRTPDSEAEAAAWARVARGDHDMYPCRRPRWLPQRNKRTGEPSLLCRRCEHGGVSEGCNGCRCWLIDRELGNFGLRLGTVEHAGGCLYVSTIAESDWDAVHACMTRMRARGELCSYATIRMASTAQRFVVSTAQVPGVGARPQTARAILRQAERLLHADPWEADGERGRNRKGHRTRGKARPVTTSHDWRLPRDDYVSEWEQAGDCNQNLTRDSVHEIARAAGATTFVSPADPCGSAAKAGALSRARFYWPQKDLDRVSVAHLFGMLRAGEVLPRWMFADDAATRFSRHAGAGPGQPSAAGTHDFF